MRPRLALVFLLLAACGSRAAGPRPIAWDREACAHCHMLIGDPSTAAQLVTAGGDALSFDDPGCLFTYVAERKPEIAALWFHHHVEDRWLRGDAAGFIAAQTPMGYGLAAVDRDAPGTITLAAAQARRTERNAP